MRIKTEVFCVFLNTDTYSGGHSLPHTLSVDPKPCSASEAPVPRGTLLERTHLGVHVVGEKRGGLAPRGGATTAATAPGSRSGLAPPVSKTPAGSSSQAALRTAGPALAEVVPGSLAVGVARSVGGHGRGEGGGGGGVTEAPSRVGAAAPMLALWVQPPFTVTVCRSVEITVVQ